MRRRLLLIEDNADDVMLFQRGIADAGFGDCLDVAWNGDQAAQRILADPPDFIVLDLDVPVLNGFDLLQLVRETCPRLPVAVITGSSSPRRHALAYVLGANLVYEKPVDAERYAALAAALACLVQSLIPWPRQEAPIAVSA
jgi:CheY-like chemotaxis protein